MPPSSLTTNRLLSNDIARAESTTRSAAKTRIRNRLVQKFKGTNKISATPSQLRNRDSNHTSGKTVGGMNKSSLNEHKVLFLDSKSKSEHTGGEVTAVPNPTPDTGFRPTQSQIPGYPPTIATLSASPNPSTPAHQNQTTTFTLLPPLLSLGPSSAHMFSPSRTTTAFPSSFTSLEPTNAAAKISEKNQLSQPHRLSTPIIVLLAVGSGLLLAGLLILIKFCARPARRPRLIPSLPILDDSFADDDRFQAKASKESPIFGGKERLSPRPGSNGLWAWTQYSQPGTEKAQAASINMGDNPYGYGAVSRSPRLQGKMTYSGVNGKAQYHFTGHAHTQSAPIQTPVNSPCQPSMQQVQNTVCRAAKRVSVASMSLYAASPRPSQIDAHVAAGGSGTGTIYTADGHRAIERSKSRASLDRDRGNLVNEGPVSKSNRYPRGAAYDGADVSSPAFLSYTIPQPYAAPSRGGRTRIKSSYYAPGAYPRISDLPSLGSDVDVNSSSRLREREQQSVRKSDSRRDRDTQALTSALGLTSPTTEYTMPSPQPTLYPDDSLSVIDIRRPRKSSVRRAPSNRTKDSAYTNDPSSAPVISTAQDASAALGSLMLLDFSGPDSQQRTVNPKPVGNSTGSSLPRSNSAAKKRSDDKAPSIPLPPPLPSLTQMGLEHVNPQAYADYRSPTYSIYGLYESDRKSGFGS